MERAADVTIDRDSSSSHVLDSLFAPRTVALIGASERSFLAKTVWNSLRAGGFEGIVFPINPSRSEVFGVTCYPSLARLPSRPDLCLIAVSEQAALGVLEECAGCGVPSAMLFTLFGGTAAGQALRAQVKGYLSSCPMSVAGSGTFGLINSSASFMPLLASPPALTSLNVLPPFVESFSAPETAYTRLGSSGSTRTCEK